LVIQKKSFQKPDETQTPPSQKVETIKLGDMTVVKQTYQPGWQWSKHQKSIVKTNSCQVHHAGILISGKMHVKADDGQEVEFNAGDVVDIPAGHDGWVIGNEPAVFYWFKK
jgi:hypothetical protein